MKPYNKCQTDIHHFSDSIYYYIDIVWWYVRVSVLTIDMILTFFGSFCTTNKEWAKEQSVFLFNSLKHYGEHSTETLCIRKLWNMIFGTFRLIIDAEVNKLPQNEAKYLHWEHLLQNYYCCDLFAELHLRGWHNQLDRLPVTLLPNVRNSDEEGAVL